MIPVDFVQKNLQFFSLDCIARILQHSDEITNNSRQPKTSAPQAL